MEPDGSPPQKKQKQVLLGDWLTGSEETPSLAHARDGRGGSSTLAHAAAGGRGAGARTGGARDWTSYEPAHGGRRLDANARQQVASATDRPLAGTYAYNKQKGAPVVAAALPHPGGGIPRPPRAPSRSITGSAAGVVSAENREWTGLEVEEAGTGAAGGRSECGSPPVEGLEELMAGLCEEQRLVINLVLGGKSVFFTGAAGTGKSFLIKRLHQALQRIGKGPGTYLTGTTGKAAVGIGGSTVHSFAGIGLGNQPVEELLGRVQRNRQAKKRWADCRVLVIDEVSMMDGELFDKLNLLGQRMKGSSQPFGGVQLVLCGDFFQLPPVGIGRGSTRFCFEARTWDTSVDQSVVLKQVFRQRDPAFLRILHEMREGRVGEEARRTLEAKVRQARQRQRVAAGDGCLGGGEPAPLVETRDGGGPAGVPIGRGGGGASGYGYGEGGQHRDRAGGSRKDVTYTRLFSRNEDVDRLNHAELQKLGGEVLSFQANDSGDPAYLKQLQAHCAAPEILDIKVGAKVLLLKNVDTSCNLVNGATGVVREFIEASGRRLPKVEFDALEGYEPVVTVIREEEWTINLAEREMARRVQLPLRLAWALSVHKSQGMTIANVMVSTQGMFEYGQAYVALSRATTLGGLELLDFDPRVVRAHFKVKAFYTELEARAKGHSTGSVTTVPRHGPAPTPAGGWISRSSPTRSNSLPAETSKEFPSPGSCSRPSRSIPSGTAAGADGAAAAASSQGITGQGGDRGVLTPAIRQRIEENRMKTTGALRLAGLAAITLPVEGDTASHVSKTRELGAGDPFECVPCEYLFSKLEFSSSGKRIQDVSMQERGEPKTGTGFMFGWATRALKEACDYFQTSFGQDSCRLEDVGPEADKVGATQLTFDPSLGTSDARCSCPDVERVTVTISRLEKHALPVAEDCPWGHPNSITRVNTACKFPDGSAVQDHYDLWRCMHQSSCNVTDHRQQMVLIRDPRPTAVSTYFHRMRFSEHANLGKIEDFVLSMLPTICQWTAIRHILFEGFMSDRSSVFWYDRANDYPLEWHYQFYRLVGLNLPPHVVEAATKYSLARRNAMNPHPTGAEATLKRSFKDEIDPSVLDEVDDILRRWLPPMMLVKFGVTP